VLLAQAVCELGHHKLGTRFHFPAQQVVMFSSLMLRQLLEDGPTVTHLSINLSASRAELPALSQALKGNTAVKSISVVSFDNSSMRADEIAIKDFLEGSASLQSLEYKFKFFTRSVGLALQSGLSNNLSLRSLTVFCEVMRGCDYDAFVDAVVGHSCTTHTQTELSRQAAAACWPCIR
jgi:hypothetical protein